MIIWNLLKRFFRSRAHLIIYLFSVIFHSEHLLKCKFFHLNVVNFCSFPYLEFNVLFYAMNDTRLLTRIFLSSQHFFTNLSCFIFALNEGKIPKTLWSHVTWKRAKWVQKNYTFHISRTKVISTIKSFCIYTIAICIWFSIE